ncbi:MAG: WxcM-like domain-containing protein [Candidatus Woesearchaeota archaeon]
MDYKINRLSLEIKKKVFVDRKGTLIQCLTRDELKNNGSHIDFGTIYGGSIIKGKIRGNHYHKNKEEYIIILKGKAKVYLEDINTKERLEGIIMSVGDRIRIGKNIAHAIKGFNPVIFFSYATRPFEEDPDTYKHEVL